MAEYGEDLVKEYLENEDDSGQWFVILNHKVKIPRGWKEIDVLAVKVNNENKVIDKIVGEVKSWMDYTVCINTLKEINDKTFKHAKIIEEIERIIGKGYRKVVFCPWIPTRKDERDEFEKFKKDEKIDIITFEKMLVSLYERAMKNKTKYEPKYPLSHTLRHVNLSKELKEKIAKT
ncbi:MAG: hypothetical protein LRZ87_00560, partial [Methanocellales archaeon]|nr:hypothetical protein [Methanocellales archaeon]